MNNDINDINQPVAPNNGKALAGIILLVVGAILLFKQFGLFGLPGWLFSFPMLLVVIGLYIGAKNNFSNLSWVIVTVIGFAFLLDDIFPHFDVSDFFWPAAMIGFGVYLILRRKNHNYWDKNEWKKKWKQGKYNYNYNYNYGNSGPAEPVVDYTVKDEAADTQTPPNTGPTSGSSTGTNYTGDEHLESISVFGSNKKVIFSKNFQGGEIVNVMGGTELDFTQADIKGRVYIDVTQIFGGTKIIVPSHWMVVSNMAAVFAGVDDKRIRTNAPLDSEKVLVLTGVSIFAGVDVRSY
ncbi:LiaF transmembrane domain-containing protein [Mucilaginibacter panaciglaebae]|uniref:Cell wall-active antibiotic response 4TMS protein YvqF n=1 Tax=Mucilaginibacter panaciglaebae TaxID=502331 RepID=A0ABP7WPM8_9SPHI